jgi:hypothetical protein
VLFLVPLGVVVSLGYGAVQRLWGASEPRLRQALAGEVTRYLGSRVEIRRLSLSSHGITLRGVTIADPAEHELARLQPIAEATEVRVPFDASFVQRLTAQAHEPLIDTVHLQSLHLVLRRDSDGRWNVSRLIKPSRVPPKRTWLGAL